jgi:hypothetical protein
VKLGCFAESGRPLFIRFFDFAKTQAAVPKSATSETGHVHQSDFAQMLIRFCDVRLFAGSVVFCTVTERNMGTAVVCSNPRIQSCFKNCKSLARDKFPASGKRLRLRNVIVTTADRSSINRPAAEPDGFNGYRPLTHSFRRVSFCSKFFGTWYNDRNIQFHAKFARTRESGNKHARSRRPLLLII